MMQEHLDEVKDVCVSDTPEMEEERHLQQTEVKEPLIIRLHVYPLRNINETYCTFTVFILLYM